LRPSVGLFPGVRIGRRDDGGTRRRFAVVSRFGLVWVVPAVGVVAAVGMAVAPSIPPAEVMMAMVIGFLAFV
jgi:hypothetical protein